MTSVDSRKLIRDLTSRYWLKAGEDVSALNSWIESLIQDCVQQAYDLGCDETENRIMSELEQQKEYA